MYKLMKLECKKFKFHFISKGTIIANLSILAFLIFTGFIGVQENDAMCKTVEDWLVTINIFTMGTFVIYGSTVLSKFIISEYRNKTMQLMFMYPIDRKKLLLSKTLIVFLFTVINLALSNIFLTLAMWVTEHFLNTVPGEFNIQAVLHVMPLSLVCILSSGFLVTATLFFGMRKKSTVHTLVAGIVIAVIICSSMGSMNMTSYLIRIIVTGIIAMVSFFLTIRHTLNNVDLVD